MSFAGVASPMACEQTYTKRRHVANELAKRATPVSVEGIVFFGHFLRRTHHCGAYKRVKTFFARGNWVRGGADCAAGRMAPPASPARAVQRELPSVQQTQNESFYS